MISNYIKKNKEIQEILLEFIDKQDNLEENFLNFQISFQENKIADDKHEFKLLLHFIASISDNHYRESNFFDKIEKILINFQEEIKNNYSNKEIFNIFKNNKRILLFLFEQKIVKFDQSIRNAISTDEYSKKSYLQYFSPEFDSNTPLPEDFEENRKRGENEHFICTLIQKDSIEDFITFVNKNNYSLKSTIEPSIFETNSFLLENESPTLIEYSVFYGSVQIFKYLRLNGVELTSSLWLFAIHGRNPEIIHLLEEDKIQPEIEIKIEDKTKSYNNTKTEKVVSYEECYFKSIQFHHNELKEYIENNYLSNNDSYSRKVLLQSIKYYNFGFFEENNLKLVFHQLCKYDYFYIIKTIIENMEIDINSIEDNKTALLIAVEIEDLDLVRLLLSNEKIDINLSKEHLTINEYKNKYSEKIAPFYLAVEKENLEIIKLFLKHEKIDINCLNKVVSYSEKEGGKEEDDEEEEENSECDVQECSDNFYEPMNNSEEYRDPSIKTIKNDEKTPLYLAIEKGNNEIIQLLLENEKIDLNVVNKIETKTDEYYEKYNKYKRGNTIGWSVSTTKKEEKTAFYLAVEKGNLELIKKMLSNDKVDINIIKKSETKINDDKDAYVEATDSEIQETIETVFKTALYFAVENEKLELLNLLLSNESIDVNLACKSDEYYRLAYFNENRMEHKYEVEKTPFYLAVEYKNIEIINLLLQNKNIDINKNYIKSNVDDKYDEDGEKCSTEEYKIKRSPLHLAVYNNNVDIVKILLNQKNIDLNAKDNDGKTPIELTNNKEILNLLNK